MIQGGNIIRVYHSPQDVIVKPQAKLIEIHESNGILTESFDLIDKNLSWFEDKETDCAEIVLTLKVGNKSS